MPYDCLCHAVPEDVVNKTTVSDRTPPRLVDDSLCEAFGLLKEIQVSLSTFTTYNHADIDLCRTQRTC